MPRENAVRWLAALAVTGLTVLGGPPTARAAGLRDEVAKVTQEVKKVVGNAKVVALRDFTDLSARQPYFDLAHLPAFPLLGDLKTRYGEDQCAGTDAVGFPGASADDSGGFPYDVVERHLLECRRAGRHGGNHQKNSGQAGITHREKWSARREPTTKHCIIRT